MAVLLAEQCQMEHHTNIGKKSVHVIYIGLQEAWQY